MFFFFVVVVAEFPSLDLKLFSSCDRSILMIFVVDIFKNILKRIPFFEP